MILLYGDNQTYRHGIASRSMIPGNETGLFQSFAGNQFRLHPVGPYPGYMEIFHLTAPGTAIAVHMQRYFSVHDPLPVLLHTGEQPGQLFFIPLVRDKKLVFSLYEPEYIGRIALSAHQAGLHQ